VLIRGGEWTLVEPIVFLPDDSAPDGARTAYAAWHDERPVFNGGLRIHGFTVGTDGVWRTSLPPEAGAGVEHLYVNGRRAVRARHPTTGAFLLKAVQETPAVTGATARPPWTTVRLHFDPSELAPLAGLEPAALARAPVVVHHNWDHTRRYVAALDAAAGVLTTTGRPMKSHNPMAKGCLAYFENVPTACDAPGEWCVEGSTLVYRPLPGESSATADVRAARLRHLLRFDGDPAAGRLVRNLRLEGLAFLHADHRTPPEGFEPRQAAADTDAAAISRAPVAYGSATAARTP